MCRAAWSARCRDEDRTVAKCRDDRLTLIEESHAPGSAYSLIPSRKTRPSDAESGGGPSRTNDVAVSNGGVDEPRSVGIRLDLSSEPADRVVNGPREPWIRKSPQVAQELVSPNNPARATIKHLQVEFTMGEMDLLLPTMGRVRPEVDPNRTHLQDFGGRPSTLQDGVTRAKNSSSSKGFVM